MKPDKAKAVENYLIQMARYGQLPGKVSYGIFFLIFSHTSIFKPNSFKNIEFFNVCKLTEKMQLRTSEGYYKILSNTFYKKRK